MHRGGACWKIFGERGGGGATIAKTQQPKMLLVPRLAAAAAVVVVMVVVAAGPLLLAAGASHENVFTTDADGNIRLRGETTDNRVGCCGGRVCVWLCGEAD